MQRVNWSPDERVDVPDMMAATSGLAESEFRRLLAQWALGYEMTAVMRGFEVEPESPASSRVVVRMDRSADAVPNLPTSMALGAENLGSRLDFGVMIGGHGSDGTLEGPAQQVLDFAPQPTGAYVVEMRTFFVEAQNDNRAFWDEGADSEYSAATNTRVQQSWELRASPSLSGGEWVPLGFVAWAGSTIDAGDIADARLLLHEGFAAQGFDATAQATAQFDYDRSPLRGKFGVGAASPLVALAALQRQALDLKGQDDRGQFNWYARALAPAGPSLWGKQTKSLRTLDTVTFTVGWPAFGGFGDWGDFNGETGLNDCLSFIQAHAAVLPRKIKILLKNRIPGLGEGTLAEYVLKVPVVIPNKDLEIIGELGQGKASRDQGEVSKDVRGQTQITTTGLPQFAIALQLTGRCSLRMENLTWREPSYEVHQVVLSGPVKMRNCVMLGYAVGIGYVALHCHSDQSDIDQCWFGGTVNYGGGDDVIHFHGGSVRHTVFDRCLLQLRTSIATGALTVLEILQGVAQKVRFEHCDFVGRLAFSGINGPSLSGCVDTRGSSHVSFDHCKLLHSNDENGIVFGNLISGIDGGSVNSGSMDVGYCEAAMIEDLVTVTSHAYRAGVNGVDGTGWHLFCKHQNLTQSSQRTTGLSVHDCWFPGGVLGTPPSPDAGALSFISACSVSVRDNRFTDWVDSAVPGLLVLVNITSDGAGTGFTQAVGVSFENNFFGDWLSDIQKVVCAAFSNVFSASIKGNMFRRFKREQGTATQFGGAALTLTNSIDFWLCDNDFVGFVDVVDPAGTNCNVVLSGILQDGHVSGNVLTDFGGIGIGAAFSVIDNVEFNFNVFLPHDLSELAFTAAIDLDAFGTGTTDNVTFIGNRWNYIGGTGGTNARTAIHVGTGFRFTVMGNHFDVGIIRHATLGGVQAPKATGYGVVAPQLNYVASYA